MASDLERAREIFLHAVGWLPADQWDAYVGEACGGDAALAGRVRHLLRAHADAGSFLEGPAANLAATVDQPPAAEGPGTLVGPYKLLEPIGEGGFGVVFLAEQAEPVRRKVALKVLKPGMDTRQVVARFEAERQALAIMDHPNIAKVFDGGATPSGRPYFVMELVKGVPITDFCDQHHLTPRQRLELFVSVCQAVQHAHQKGIIHRDLKPSNILVSRHDTTPVVKVIDFGVAKALGQELTDKTLFTGVAQMIGTPLYMSPEQAGMSDLDVDTRSDIYSLGVLLYELLTGTTPFPRERFKKAAYDEIRRIIREEEPPKPSTRLSDSTDSLPSVAAQRQTEPAKLTRLVRGELDWIVMKALEKDRNRRYETANGFAADAQRYLADEPVLACPPSARYRLRKFARRNKGGLAVFVLVLSFLVLLGSGAGWAVRDRSAREAEAARQQGERQAKAGGQVESIFAEVDRLEREQKWAEALAAARRAEAIVAGGEVDAATEQRVRERLKDLEFVDRLDQVRVQWVTGNGLSLTDREYARAFRDHGVDLDGLTVDASVERLKAWPALTIPLAASLDDWIYIRRQATDRDAADWKRLAAVARGIDPEPLRDQLRSTWDQPAAQTRDELRRLAESIDVRAHHPTTLVNLARTLQHVALPDHAVRVLRDARHAYPGDFWLNHSLAFALSEQQDHEGAVQFMTAATSIRPDSAVAHYNLGVLLGGQKRLDEAIAAYRKAIEINPREYAAHPNLAWSLREQGRVDEADKVYRKLIELYPDDSRARFVLGGFLRAQGKVDEANAAYAQAIELARREIERQPKLGSRPYLTVGWVLDAQGKRDEAVEEYRKAVEADPKDLGARIRLAEGLQAQGKRDEAVEEYRKAVEADPKDFGAQIQLAQGLRAQGRRDEAIAAYRKAIELDPIRGKRFRGNVAELLRERGRLDEAIAAYRKAIDVDANDADAYYGLGILLKAQKRPDEAIAAYRKAIELDPKNAAAHLNLGDVLRERGKLDEAIAAARTVIALDPTVTNPNMVGGAYVNLGEALHDKKWFADAIAAYTRGVELEPKHAAYTHRKIKQMRQDKESAALSGRADFKKLVAAVEARRPLNDRAWELATDPDPTLRDPTRAVELAEKAVAELPKDANCRNTLGVARYRAGDYQGAVAALMEYRELRTSDAEWTNPFFLAMAHWKLDHKDEAARWYKLAAEWMERKKANSEMMRRVRAEAAELLAVENK